MRDGAIWSMNVDGGDVTQLTHPVAGASDEQPAWSPGGTMLAYTHRPEPFAADVWLMQADGSAQRPWITSSRYDIEPTWSPDAVVIAFTSDRNAIERTPTGEFHTDIWVHGASSPFVVRVTRLEPSRRHGAGAAWSPERTAVAIVTQDADGRGQLAVKAVPQGTGYRCDCPVEIIAEHDEIVHGADWSPDGAVIAYGVTDGCCTGDIWTVMPGQDPQPLITGPTSDGDPAWSPDGTKIVFDRDGVLHTADADGANIQSLGVEGGQPAWQPIPDEPLVDARFDTLGEHIVWARQRGITTGCAPERFCPDHAVRRGQAASFISHALDLPPATGDHFTDDTGSVHEDEINRLYEAGISAGCGGGRFCVNHVATRGMMAAWLDRALDPPDTTEDAFTDDEHSAFEPEINRLAAAGIVSGCAADRFCSLSHVTRAQAVAMLHRALD